MAVLRLFAGAREAAGIGRDEVQGATVAEVLERRPGSLRRGLRRGPRALPRCGATASRARRTTRVVDDDEVAVLPPVSGGAALMATRTEERGATARRRRRSGRAPGAHVPSPGSSRYRRLRAALRGRRTTSTARSCASGSLWFAGRRGGARRRPAADRPASTAARPRWPPRRRRAPGAASDGPAAQPRLVAAGHGRGARPRRLPGRRRRRARSCSAGWRSRRWSPPVTRRRPTPPSPTPGGRSSAPSRLAWRRCRWCSSPGSTRARPSRCCCWCPPTRRVTTSWARGPGTPSRARSPAWRRWWWSPSSCRRCPSRRSTSPRPGCSAGSWRVLAPARPAVRQRAPADGGLARLRAPPPRLAAARSRPLWCFGVGLVIQQSA